MKLIQRDKYLNQLISLSNTPDIKVITGIRRSGKSELLKAYMRYIEKTEHDSNIIYINFQDLEFDYLKEYHALHDYVLSKNDEGKHNVLIIDEIQMCEHFELAINSLHAKGIFDIYITGSNAFLLSSDLATLFTGRTVEIMVYPFSFKEYLTFFESNTDINQSFDEYVRDGGLPGAYVYNNEDQKSNYVKDVYLTILTRDLVQKYNIRNKEELKRIADFAMDNISNLMSVNNITDTLNANQSRVTNKTVSRYLDYFKNAFLFYEASRYDLKGKKYLKSNHKLYLADPVIRRSVLGSRNMDYGRVYENLVYLELLRRGYEVYVGKLYKKEIDFVALKRDEKIYIQVSDDISSEDTLSRELAPLNAIRDAYPKMLIARTRHPKFDREGVQIMDLADWLLATE